MIDSSLTGHLAVAHRGGELAKIIGATTVYIRDVNEARSLLSQRRPPKAILIGGAYSNEVEELLNEEELHGIPTLIIERLEHGWPDLIKRDWVHVSQETASTAVAEFATRVLGYESTYWHSYTYTERALTEGSRQPSAWLIEDNARVRADVSATLRSAGFDVQELASQGSFVLALSRVEMATASVPRVLVLDLRLPWGEDFDLAENAMAAGLWCLELLRQEPLTASVPVVIYSAFVRDELVSEKLAPHQPVTVVDKMEPDRLRVVIENLLPGLQPKLPWRLKRFGKRGENRLLRIGALSAAIVAIAGVITLAIHWITHWV